MKNDLPWLHRSPTLDEVAEHAAAHPCHERLGRHLGGLWLCIWSTPRGRVPVFHHLLVITKGEPLPRYDNLARKASEPTVAFRYGEELPDFYSLREAAWAKKEAVWLPVTSEGIPVCLLGRGAA